MRIKLPNYTTQNEDKTPKFSWFLSLLILFVVGLIIGFELRNFVMKNASESLRARNDVLEEQNKANLDKIAQLEADISLLTTDKKVTKQAALKLQEDYKELLNKNSQLDADLKFYERLLSSSSKKKGVRIFDARILNIKNNKYSIKFSIVQKIEKAREVSGKYRVSIVGKEKNQQKTIKVTENDNKYRFKYFQNISLDFLLPNGFIAQQLVVELFPQNKKAKPIKHSIDWSINSK